MDELIQTRFRLKSKLTRVEKFSQECDPATVKTSDINVRLELMSEMWNEFDNVQSEIERSCKKKDLDEQTLEQEEFENKFLSVKSNLKSLLEQVTAAMVTSQSLSTITSSTITTSPSHVKLPFIDLPIFNGDYQNWTSFYDLFNSLIHNNTALSPVQKLHYLKSSLRGDAGKLLNSITTTNVNYIEALNILKDRYANKRQIVYCHLKSLFSQLKLNTECAGDLRKLIDVTVENVRGLHVLGLPTDQWDCLLVFIVLERVDSDTRRQWELTTSQTDIPTFAELKQFLETRCRALEAAGAGKVKLTSIKGASNHSAKRSNGNSMTYHTVKYCYEKCKGDHPIHKCEHFIIGLSIKERVDFIKANSLCFNCMRSGHYTQQCKSCLCRRCNKPHHTMLHYEEAASVSTHFNTDNVKSQVLLATAMVKLQDSLGQYQMCRSLLDSASQASFISEACVQRLGLKHKKAHVTINGLAQSGVSVSKGIVQLRLTSMDNSSSYSLQALILHRVIGQLPVHHIDSTTCDHSRNLRLADPTFHQPGEIDLLIGAELWPELILSGKIMGPSGTPIAQNTTLGWILSGRVKSSSHSPINTYHVAMDISDQLHQFWELEEIPFQRILAAGEKECEEHFRSTHSCDKTGRYVVWLPFKNDNKTLGNSREIAKNRLLQVERRMIHQPEKKQQYVDFMNEYLTLGHMQLVSDVRHSSSVYYLPHHAVIKESSSTTKLRVVFDGTVKPVGGCSLNEKLLVGPTVQEDLVTILLRFRMHNIAFSADINKMYRQVVIHPADRDYQRILWRPSFGEPIQEYRLNTVTYGTASAPYLATKCLAQLAHDGQGEFPLASVVLKNDFYVDDLMSGSDSLSEALQLQSQLIKLLQSAGFELRKWSSSEPDLLDSLPRELCASQSSHRFDVDEVVKTLGLHWLPAADCFMFKISTISDSLLVNKRVILSEISQLFDPLGLLAPIIVCAKLLIQKLWLLGVAWDETLPSDVITTWNQYKSELPMIEEIKLTRKVVHDSNYKNYQLHGFCDASEKAYGAVIFLRSTDGKNKVYTNLICAKSRVAPIKQVSLPRLELCGAVLLAKLMNRVHNVLAIDINCVYLWTDSMVVLAWLSGHANQWKTFVANRVSQIQELFPPHHWNHVKSADNPADCLSRGLTPSQLINFSLWWYGPKWLNQEEDVWPRVTKTQQPGALVECKKTMSTFTTTITDDSLISQYSSLTKLVRVTAYCQRFSNNCKLSNDKRLTGPLSTKELQYALFVWIKQAQATVFSREIETCVKKTSISSKSQLLSLHPFLDSFGILRVGGRLQESRLQYDQKHPIILPGCHVLTDLIITHEHLANLHAGPQLLLATIRRRYWILHARRVIRHHVHKCVKCFRYRVSTSQQLMGNLPTNRLQPVRAFLRSGVDYAGPIQLRLTRGRGGVKSHKAYICVFVCFVVKAIHLELANDLSTDSFIAALQRFIARRGRPSDIYSDCGTNFVGADRELRELYGLLGSTGHNSVVARTLSSEGINWHFNPPAAPHFGGLWEAGVKSVKYHLRRVVGNSILSYEEMYTVLTQIEACLNSRPLCPQSSDPTDFTALTPGHFLIGEELTSIPEPDLTELKLNRLSRWQLVQRLFQNFWKRWSSEYLARLQQRPKWASTRKNIDVGDLIILKEENVSPLNWPLARVVKTHPGRDNLVRVVTLKTINGIFKRPISKCCLLPVDT